MNTVYLARWIKEGKSIKGSIPAHYSYDAHTKECALQKFAAMRMRQEWLDKWPNHCEICEGAGVIGNLYMVSNHGEWYDEGLDPCECQENDNIYDELKCPRCGEDITDLVIQGVRETLPSYTDIEAIDRWLFNAEKCPVCGWANGFGPDDIAPRIPGCYCAFERPELLRLDKPGRFQRLVFRIFGDRFQSLFKIPIWKDGEH